MTITFEMACKDDCLDKIIPSDLRQLVVERDKYKAVADVAFSMFGHSGLSFLNDTNSVVRLAHVLGEAGYPGFSSSPKEK